MKKILAYLGFLAGLALVGCGPSSEGPQPLRVGMDLTYPPFESITPEGNPVGVSVDLAVALAEYLGRPIKIENIPFTGLIPSLQSNKIDLIISSMTDTEERRSSIAFSDAYLSTGLALLVGKDSPVQSAEDLRTPGRRIAVRQGTTGQLWATANLPEAELIVLEKENAAVLEVIQGKADAFLYDQMSVWKNQQEHPETTRALLAPVRVEKWAIGLRLGDEALREEVNAFLRDFRERGGFEDLGNRYLGEQKKAFAAEGVEFLF
jgi:polar amino acid transport system substrate-binding protein